jgi:tetratricopeptide (TPR) repeat protein
MPLAHPSDRMTSDPFARRPPRPFSGWSPHALVLFVSMMLVLTGIGLFGRLHHAHGPTGFPRDAAVDSARASLRGALGSESAGLRFASSLEEDARAAVPPVPPDSMPAAIAAASRWMAVARSRLPFDPRVVCLSAHLDLAADRLERAERLYRAALALAPRYGEARLGLGVTLARRAATEGDERSVRALELEAAAQFAAVAENDRFYLPALYDRTVMLARVGRTQEAAQLARRYAALDPGSEWARTLQRRVSPGPPG